MIFVECLKNLEDDMIEDDNAALLKLVTEWMVFGEDMLKEAPSEGAEVAALRDLVERSKKFFVTKILTSIEKNSKLLDGNMPV